MPGAPRSLRQRRDLPQIPLVFFGISQPMSGSGRQRTSGRMPSGLSVRHQKVKGPVVCRATMP